MHKEQKDNWRMRNPGIPDFIPAEKEQFYPACGRGMSIPGYIPDPEAEAELPDHMRPKTITAEQEMYGLDLSGKGKPPKKTKPHLNPLNG